MCVLGDPKSRQLAVEIHHHSVLPLASAAGSLLNVIIGSVLSFPVPPALLNSASISPLVLSLRDRNALLGSPLIDPLTVRLPAAGG